MAKAKKDAATRPDITTLRPTRHKELVDKGIALQIQMDGLKAQQDEIKAKLRAITGDQSFTFLGTTGSAKVEAVAASEGVDGAKVIAHFGRDKLAKLGLMNSKNAAARVKFKPDAAKAVEAQKAACQKTKRGAKAA